MVEITIDKTKLDKEGYNRLLMEIREAEKRYRQCLGAHGLGVINGGAGTRVNENFDVICAKDDISKTLGELNRLKAILSNAEVVESNDNNGIGIGDIVTLFYDDIKETCRLVSYSPEANEISIQSPLGKAISGANIGDICKYEACEITYAVTILDIEKASELSQNEPQRTK